MIKKRANQYWSKFLRAFDRDKLKSALYPDRDWEHLVAFFALLVLIFAAISGYLYMKVGYSGSAERAPVSSSDGKNAAAKLENAVSAINKAESAFNDLLLKKPDVADPSK